MISAFIARFRQGHRTMPYPDAPLQMPARFRGLPALASLAKIGEAAACPYGAYSGEAGGCLDLGKCLFCSECQVGSVEFTTDYRLSVREREHLKVRPGEELKLATALSAELLRMFGRSLKFREVSAGGCNACEADTNVLSTIGWDLGRFGIQFVASPRHADGLWVTGPVSENMREALLTTYEAIPAPKIVVACGACAINGGPYIDSPEACNGTDRLVPVDLYIPGCPPHPATILDGILRILDKIH